MSEVTPSNSVVDRSARDNRTFSDSNFACLARITSTHLLPARDSSDETVGADSAAAFRLFLGECFMQNYASPKIH